MKAIDTVNVTTTQLPLILGATGKTGRRVAQRLEAAGLPYRAGSRTGPMTNQATTRCAYCSSQTTSVAIAPSGSNSNTR